MRTLIAAALLSTTPALAADRALPGWLAGHWCNDGAEEHWLAPAGGLMVAVNRSLSDGKAQFEFLRIEMIDGVPTYVAQPGGAAGTSFAMSDGGKDWIRFSNTKHDFPQHIEYRRRGDALEASIAGPGENGEQTVIPFQFQRCPG
jgi:hypothetical protein